MRSGDDLLCASCSYTAPDQDGVYNLLPSRARADLYPGDRDDIIDFSLPGHETKLRSGWYELDGVYGGKYRWMGGEASAQLRPIGSGQHRLRIRGYAAEASFREQAAVRVSFFVNEAPLGEVALRGPGTFIFEAALPAAPDYLVRIQVERTIRIAGDDRAYGVNFSLIRLVRAE